MEKEAGLREAANDRLTSGQVWARVEVLECLFGKLGRPRHAATLAPQPQMPNALTSRKMIRPGRIEAGLRAHSSGSWSQKKAPHLVWGRGDPRAPLLLPRSTGSAPEEVPFVQSYARGRPVMMKLVRPKVDPGCVCLAQDGGPRGRKLGQELTRCLMLRSAGEATFGRCRLLLQQANMSSLPCGIRILAPVVAVRFPGG